MSKLLNFVLFFCIFVANLYGEVPNFLMGLDQNKTMAFYAIESGLNLSKDEIARRKTEWAAGLPYENRIAFEKFNDLAKQTRIQHLNTVTTNQLSPEANAIRNRIQSIINDRSLSRTAEVEAIENILAQSSPAVDAELIDNTPPDAMKTVQNNAIEQQISENSDNTFNQQPSLRPRKTVFSSIGNLNRASASFPPNRIPIFQG